VVVPCDHRQRATISLLGKWGISPPEQSIEGRKEKGKQRKKQRSHGRLKTPLMHFAFSPAE
jgi:hypothetical protein